MRSAVTSPPLPEGRPPVTARRRRHGPEDDTIRAMIWDPFRLVIAICWAVFIVVWAVTALFVKRTVERSLGWARVVAFAAVIGVYAALRGSPVMQRQLWPRNEAVGLTADLLALLGLVIALWARAALGRNWSGTIAFKEDHELIQRGPYAWVRHPIYSGLLLMVLGTAIDSTRLASFAFLATGFVVVVIKARAEEQLMLRHFPDAYARYRRRVKALVPWVW